MVGEAELELERWGSPATTSSLEESLLMMYKYEVRYYACRRTYRQFHTCRSRILTTFYIPHRFVASCVLLLHRQYKGGQAHTEA